MLTCLCCCFAAQALIAVNRANLLTRLWKGAPRSLLRSEYFFYTQVRNLVESDPDIFSAGNCYGHRQYKKYDLWCPFGYRLSNDSSQVCTQPVLVRNQHRTQAPQMCGQFL